jgi:hypothetical protein
MPRQEYLLTIAPEYIRCRSPDPNCIARGDIMVIEKGHQLRFIHALNKGIR